MDAKDIRIKFLEWWIRTKNNVSYDHQDKNMSQQGYIEGYKQALRDFEEQKDETL